MSFTCPKKCGEYYSSFVADHNNNKTVFSRLDSDQWAVYTPNDEAEKQHATQITGAVNAPAHYVGKIETIDYLRDKLTPAEFTGFCMGNVLKYTSRWRKKDGLQDLKKAMVYLNWAIENEEKHAEPGEQ